MRPLPLRWLYSTTACLVLMGTPAWADLASVPEVLERLVARNNGHGGGIMRISNAQGLVWQGAAGLVAGPGSAPMTPDTPFEVASVTKAVTAATILRLVEQGKLRLDSPMIDVLPQAEAHGFDRTITIAQLLSHTSGLPDYWTDGPHDRSGNNAFLRAFLADPNHSWQPGEMIAFGRDLPAKHPGGRFHYSDTNYVLLGRIIENVTGAPLHRVYRELVFEPLGMRDTWLSYHEDRRGAMPSHRFEGADDLNDLPRQGADWAGGGLISTAQDLERFLRGLASGRLFRQPGTLDAMREAVPVEEDITYGLGLYRVKLENGQGELWGHDGHGNSFAYYWPQHDVTLTGTLNQTENDWWPLAEAYIDGGNAAALVEENDKSFSVTLSTGWDSLYMSNGVNSLPNGAYGAGIASVNLDVTWSITESDSITLNLWQCFATQGASYRELDSSLTYTRSFDSLDVSFQYSFDYGDSDGSFFSHELSVNVGYDISLGALTLRPSINYDYNLGPDSATGSGFAKSGSSFLFLRLDGQIPVYRDIVSLAPWTAYGLNFEYNTRETSDDDIEPFTGPNHMECGLAVPIQINRMISVSAYAAYSRAFTNLTGTAPNTFWSGVSVNFSY